jgi:excisionase family DNA binding protein
MLLQVHENGQRAALTYAEPKDRVVPSLLMDVEGIAETLCISTRTAKRLLARKCLPVVKIGRRTLVRRSELERWVAGGCRVKGRL